MNTDGFAKDEIDDDPGWSPVPHGLWTHPALSHLDKVVLAWLWSHDNGYLAKLSTRGIRRAFNGSGAIPGVLARLETAGFVSTSTPTRGHTAYRLLGPPWKALRGIRPESIPTHVSACTGGPRSGPGAVRDQDRLVVRDQDHVEDHLGNQGEPSASTPSTRGRRDASPEGQAAVKLYQRWVEWWRETHPADSYPTAASPGQCIATIKALVKSGRWDEALIRSGLKAVARGDAVMSTNSIELVLNRHRVDVAPSADRDTEYHTSSGGEM